MNQQAPIQPTPQPVMAVMNATAIRFTGTPDSAAEIIEWTAGSKNSVTNEARLTPIGTAAWPAIDLGTGASEWIGVGEWVINDRTGGFWVCSDEHFRAAFSIERASPNDRPAHPSDRLGDPTESLLTTRPVKHPAGEPRWFYQLSSTQELCGPFETKDFARIAAQRENPGRDFTLGLWRREEIDCDIFRAEYVADALVSLNEHAIWDQAMPEFPCGLDATSLETRLARVLYDWLDEHEMWDQFRGLEYAGDEE